MRTVLLQRWFRLQLSEKVTLAACAVVLFVLIILPPLQFQCGRWNGFAAANQDLEAGRLKLLRGGYRTAQFRRLEIIANQNYGIEIINTGCVPSDYGSGYAAAYNQRMQQELDRRFTGVSLSSLEMVATRSAE